MTTRVIGIGSDHGDDAVGWRVVERLLTREFSAFECMVVRTPLEALHHMEGCTSLHMIDACQGDEVGRVHRWDWPIPKADETRWTLSHSTHVPHVLRLAEALGILPMNTVVWGIEGCQFAPMSAISPELSGCIERIADALTRSLTDDLA